MLDPSSRQRRTVCIALAGAMTGVFSNAVQASDFPGKTPIKLVVTFSAGGLTDSVGRMLAAGMGEELKGTVIVENVPGATGKLGVARVARAEPDGYTLVISMAATHSIAPALYRSLPYNPEQDFTPIGKIGNTPMAILANPQLPANNLQELLALVRKQDGRMLYAAWGVGSGGQLLMEGINHLAKVRMEQVPYKGESLILQALIGGEVKVGVTSVAAVLPFLKSGRVKVLGVTGAQRTVLAPDVPTLIEQGIPLKSSAWYGIFAPAKTPPQIVEALSRALTAVMARPQVQEKLRDLGVEAETLSRDAFVRQIKEDSATWAAILANSGIKVE